MRRDHGTKRRPDGHEPVADPSEVPPNVGRRRLLALGLGMATGATAAGTLASTPAGAAAGTGIQIDRTTEGTGGTTILEYTNLGTEEGAPFRAALQDWGGQIFNVRAYGAAGNGTTDDTAAITRAIAAAAASAGGSGTVYFPPGIYKTSGISVNHAGLSVRLEAGATLKAKPGISKPVITVSARGVSILGPGTVDGSAATQTGSGTGLDGVKFSNNGDDGLVEGLLVQNAAWVGIESIGANRTRIALNRVITCGHAGISVSTTSAAIAGPVIMGNTVHLTGTTTVGINVSGGSTTHVVNRPTVIGNVVDLTAGVAYQVSTCGYARIVGNWGTGPGQVFSVVGGSDNVVEGNTAQATGNGAGIEFGSNSSICSGNTVSCTGTGAGIHADNGAGSHVVISNNKVTGAKTSGIGVGNYHHVVVTGNMVKQSTTASPGYAVIEVSPTNPGVVVVADNVCDGAGASGYGLWLNNLVATAGTGFTAKTVSAMKITVHDNAIVNIATGSSYGALRFSGSGTVTDIVVHDNTVGEGIPLFTTASGLTFGANVWFHDNIVVGKSVPGVTPVTLPASGSPYTNPNPYVEILYVWGGKLKTTGANQGIMKNGYSIAPASVKLTVPMAITLYPKESVTIYYSSRPTARKDIKA